MTQSMTFLPHFVKDLENPNIVYVDLAGQSDSSGIAIDIVNCLIKKMIFKKVKNVRIIVPIT